MSAAQDAAQAAPQEPAPAPAPEESAPPATSAVSRRSRLANVKPKYLTAFDKGASTRKLIMEALRRNTLFSQVECDPEICGALLTAFRRMEVEPGQVIMRQGDESHKFYVIEEGLFEEEVTEQTRVPTRLGMASRSQKYTVATLDRGNAFGERALYSGIPSPMTIVAKTKGVLWAIDRRSFHLNVLVDARQQEIAEQQEAISNCVEQHSFFQHLDDESKKQELINAFFITTFKAGEEIIKQGQYADNFYIVHEGVLELTRTVDADRDGLPSAEEGKQETEFVGVIKPGEGVGELAIKFPNKRAETTVRAKTDVTLFAVDRRHFQRVSKTGSRVLLQRFNRYASIERQDGSKLMTVEDFLRCNDVNNSRGEWNQAEKGEGANTRLFRLLFSVAAHGHQTLDFLDYYMFNMLMKRPYAEYEIAFRLFDVERKGSIGLHQFTEMMGVMMEAENVPLPSAEEMKRQVPEGMFGPDGLSEISYEEFRDRVHSGELPLAVCPSTYPALSASSTGEARHPSSPSHSLSPSSHDGGGTGGGDPSSPESAPHLATRLTPSDGLTEGSAGGSVGSAGRIGGRGRASGNGGGDWEEGRVTLRQVDRIIKNISGQTHWSVHAVRALSDSAMVDMDAHGGVKTDSQDAYRNSHYFLAGALAGLVSRTAVAPFDRLTILMQTQELQQRRADRLYTGVRQGLGRIVSQDGLLGLYRGNFVNMLRIMPSRAIQFWVFEELKIQLCIATNRSEKQLTFAERAMAGGIAGSTAGFLTYPLDVIRTRMAVLEGESTGIVATARHLIGDGGAWAMTQGLGATMLKVFPYVALDFAVYETAKSYVPGDAGPGSHLLCGTAAGTVSQAVVHPIDTIRRRIQNYSLRCAVTPDAKTPGIWATGKSILRHEGVRGLYAGLVPYSLKSVPAVAIGFTVYEQAKVMLRDVV